MIIFTTAIFLQVCSSSPDLCNGVLETFLGVLQGLSPLALAQSARMSPIGQRSLEQVAQFLIPCIDPERTRDRTGKWSYPSQDEPARVLS